MMCRRGTFGTAVINFANTYVASLVAIAIPILSMPGLIIGKPFVNVYLAKLLMLILINKPPVHNCYNKELNFELLDNNYYQGFYH